MTVIPILLYHSISTAPAPWIAPYSVTPSTFCSHLDLIAASGRTVVTVSELRSVLVGVAPMPARPLVITFDDGFADFAAAAEILALRRFRSTLYVTTGALRGRGAQPATMALPPADMLDWSQLGELHELGVEIGAHSHTHRQLDTLRAATVVDELRQSKDLLESALGESVPSFAYPHGFHGRRVRDAVATAGHDSACAVMNALSSDRDKLFALARLTVRATTTTELLQIWLAGEGAPIAPHNEQLRTKMWRWYRRAHGPWSGKHVIDTAGRAPGPADD